MTPVDVSHPPLQLYPVGVAVPRGVGVCATVAASLGSVACYCRALIGNERILQLYVYSHGWGKHGYRLQL
eukprot:2752826-Prymnesium_polylepis.1